MFICRLFLFWLKECNLCTKELTNMSLVIRKRVCFSLKARLCSRNYACHQKRFGSFVDPKIRKQKRLPHAILDSPYYVFVALCIVVMVVSLIFKMAYFLSWPVQELLKKARVRCAIANSKIFAKTFNIFIWGRYLYQW